MPFTSMAARSNTQGTWLFCVKSDPLSICWARHDLIKSCLPLVEAAVFKISLETHPRWL